MKLAIFHPRRVTLQSFVDEELNGTRNRRVTRHLQGCPFCRSEVERLKIDFARFVAQDRQILMEQADLLQEGLTRLRGRMQFLPFSPQPVTSFLTHYQLDPMRLRDHVFNELEVYLGSHVAEAFVERLNGFESGVPYEAAEAESLLAAFLGKRVANSVMERIFQVVQTGYGPDPRAPLVHSLV